MFKQSDQLLAFFRSFETNAPYFEARIQAISEFIPCSGTLRENFDKEINTILKLDSSLSTDTLDHLYYLFQTYKQTFE